MSSYARYYRNELRDANYGPYRIALRLMLTLAALTDRYPRLSSAILYGLSIWAVIYIFLNYRFTTYM